MLVHVAPDETLNKVFDDVAAELGVDPRTLDAGTNLVNDLGVNSIEMMAFCMQLEHTFNISVINEVNTDGNAAMEAPIDSAEYRIFHGSDAASEVVKPTLVCADLGEIAAIVDELQGVGPTLAQL